MLKNAQIKHCEWSCLVKGDAFLFSAVASGRKTLLGETRKQRCVCCDCVTPTSQGFSEGEKKKEQTDDIVSWFQPQVVGHLMGTQKAAALVCTCFSVSSQVVQLAAAKHHCKMDLNMK